MQINMQAKCRINITHQAVQQIMADISPTGNKYNTDTHHSSCIFIINRYKLS